MAAQNLRMHTNNQNLLVIGTVEDADPAPLRKATRAAPEKVMLEFLGARLLETVNLAACRVDARHHMANGAILSGTVHSLKNQQECIVVGCVVQLLERIQFLHVLE